MRPSSSTTVVSGDAARLARTLDGLDGEGVAPPLVLWAMSEEIRIAGRVLAAGVLVGTYSRDEPADIGPVGSAVPSPA